ncbi:MAG: 16S rRNA processing protein RimM [Bacteroidetes bacterium]|nr:MAG: 16S rRNA processing protein RimM [Bacteroidota bacterium]
MIERHDLTTIGKTIKPHGIAGEILCEFSLVLGDDNLPEYFIIEEFFIDSFRGRAKFSAFVHLEGVTDERTARLLCGKEILTDKVINCGEDDVEYGLSFLIGFTVVDRTYGDIGKVTAIDDSTVNTLMAVGDKLIPAQEAFITKIDNTKKIIYTQLPEGLLDI